MRRITAALAHFCCLSIALLAAPAHGQDARPLQRGTLRISLGPDWARWDSRFGRGTPGRSNGSVEPLGVDFSTDSLGVEQLGFLAAPQATMRTVTGLQDFRLNLGRARLTLNASVRVMPLSVEMALSRRISVGVMLPLYRSRSEAFLLGPSSDTGAAAALTRGNVGFNPAWQTAGAFDPFRQAADSALLALQAQATSGPPALRAQAQAQLDAMLPLVCGLYVLAAGTPSSPTSPCYQPGAVPGSPFLPVAGSPGGDSIAARLARAQQQYENLRQSYAANGVVIPPFNAAYGLPNTPLDTNGLRQFFRDPNGPLAGESLATVVRTRLGDVELSARFQLFDRARFRSQLGLVARLPTGYVDSPHNWTDIGAGDRQLDVEATLRSDVVLSNELWVHSAVRYGVQTADEIDRRVAPPNVLVVPIANLARVRRDLGDYFSLDVTPNWQLDDALSLGLGYQYYRVGVTRFSYADPADEARIGLPANVLDQETAMWWMRAAAGLTFSTLARHAEGRARFPYTVTATHYRTFQGGGGKAPDASGFVLLIRAYVGVRR